MEVERRSLREKQLAARDLLRGEVLLPPAVLITMVPAPTAGGTVSVRSCWPLIVLLAASAPMPPPLLLASAMLLRLKVPTPRPSICTTRSSLC